MGMLISETEFQGVYIVSPFRAADDRGEFIKTYHQGEFSKHGIALEGNEGFMSVSHRHVLRGMHLQVPPHAHNKLVHCCRGAALDVLVDLRSNSPTFGQSWTMELSDRNRLGVYIPVGLAHGFLSLEDNTTLVYRTDTVYHPESDTGIRWDSIPLDWPEPNPIVSERDAALARMEDFETPF
jgi:dTDP-4-dehydrorhamnose 3,5-epimerase